MNEPNPYEAPQGDVSKTTSAERPRTRWERAWPWAFWFLSLNVCWIGMIILSELYKHSVTMRPNEPVPGPIRVLYGLWFSHKAISGAAFLATFWITQAWEVRVWAWLAILVMLGWTMLMSLGAGMGLTGVYL